MSAKDDAWSKLLEIPKLQSWLHDEKSLVYQVMSGDIKRVGARPVDIIPAYGRSDLPVVLLEKGLELLRNRYGGCLLIKVKEGRLPTLFPSLPEPESKYTGPPFRPIPRQTVITDPDSDIMNEETGIHLGWSMGVFQSFFIELFSPFEEFSFGGRLKRAAKGRFRISQEEFEVHTQLEADAYFESDERIIVMEAKKTDYAHPLTDFSLHQILLPLILVGSISEKPSSAVLFDFSGRRSEDISDFLFRLYHIQVLGDGATILPFEYRITRSKEYRISIRC